MKKRELKNALKQARRKNQDGIVIFANNIAWDELSFLVKKGNEKYDKALQEAKTNQKETVAFARALSDEVLVAFICLPVKKMLHSKKYFKEMLKYCNELLISGPYMLVPSNEVVNPKRFFLL